MSEVRTTSATGGQKGVKPERFGLLPRRGLEAIARVFAFGADKYEDNNWRRGYEWSKSIDALERHVQAFKDGETNDPESGLPHLGHAGFHVLAMLTWLHDQGEGADNPMDDRWPASLERARRAEEAEEVVVEIDPTTGTSSGLPGGLGDLTDRWFTPFDLGETAAMIKIQDKINADISRLAQVMAAPALFVEEPVKSDCTLTSGPYNLPPGWADLGFINETGVAWRDPEPITLETTAGVASDEMFALLTGETVEQVQERRRDAVVADWQVNTTGTVCTLAEACIEDDAADHPAVPPCPDDAETVEPGWVRLGYEDGKVYFAREESLQPGYGGPVDLRFVESAIADELPGFIHNTFAVRRDPSYDDSYLTEVVGFAEAARGGEIPRGKGLGEKGFGPDLLRKRNIFGRRNRD